MTNNPNWLYDKNKRFIHFVLDSERSKLKAVLGEKIAKLDVRIEARRQISHAVAIESSRGWRLAKTKRGHKIDLAIALGMASWGCRQEQSQPFEVLGAF